VGSDGSIEADGYAVGGGSGDISKSEDVRPMSGDGYAVEGYGLGMDLNPVSI